MTNCAWAGWAPGGWVPNWCKGCSRRAAEVAVYNRTRAKCEPLAALGAKVVSSPAELGSRDIVFATVGTPQDLIDAVLGDGGLTSGDASPRVLVDCSTISADVSGQIRGKLAARDTDLLAAPVMGNPKVASVGKLTLAVSGPQAALIWPGHTSTCSARERHMSARENWPGR